MLTQRSATQYFRVSTNFLHADSKMFFWIRVEKSMLSVHLVLEICGLKDVVSFNFAPSAPHVKRRVKSREPRPLLAKTLAPVIQLLHSQGIQVHAYLDDWIIRATSQEQSREHTQHIIQLLQSLGWTINWDKSMLQPSRILDFLGLHFNLEQALISPPASFLPTLTEVLSHLSPSTVMSARKVSSIISRMSHFAPFISSGRLHLRFLQFWFKHCKVSWSCTKWSLGKIIRALQSWNSAIYYTLS